MNVSKFHGSFLPCRGIAAALTYLLCPSVVTAAALPDEECDVVVVGAGTAGVAAALQSARSGARTIVVEQGFQVGGTMTSGGINFPGLFHAWGRQVIDGVGYALVTNCVALSGGSLPDFTKPTGPEHWRHQISVNVPLYVALAEESLLKYGVRIHYHAAPVEVVFSDGSWRLSVVAVGDTRTIRARQVIDCTGDASVAAMAGFARERATARQPGSFVYTFDPGVDIDRLDRTLLERAFAEARADGRLHASDSRRSILGFLECRGGTANYIDDADCSTADLRTETNLRGRASMLRMYRFLRSVPGLEKVSLVSMSPEVGVRETYRVCGEYTITQDDYVSGRVFPDSLCYAFYPVDLHDKKSGVRPAHLAEGVVATVPLRALVPRGARNFLVAGRCVSSDRGANSGLRVEAACMAMGQVAGTAAALAARRGTTPLALPVDDLRKALAESGAIVPGPPVAEGDVAARAVRVFRPDRPALGNTGAVRLQPIDDACWIWGAGIDDADTFVRFRVDFPSDGTDFELDVTADSRFALFLDGREIARGPHRGDVERWYYQSYAVSGLAKGNHRFEAVVYHGDVRPNGELTWRGGFIAKASGAYDAYVTTGKAPWRVAELKTMEPLRGRRRPAVGAAYRVHGTSADADEPPASAWTNTVVVGESVLADNNCAYRIAGWMLFPSERPDMTQVRRVPGRFVTGGVPGPASVPIVVPAHTTREFLWQLGDYTCAYPRMAVQGGRGAKVRWGWTESLVGPDGKKGNRGEWKGKTFPEELPWAVWDEFLPDGRDRGEFTTPWWRAGLWCKITVETANEPLTIADLALDETHYPYDFSNSAFTSDDASLDAVRRLCLRGLEMCSHETYMDCAFHEQYQYPGDSRIEALVSSCVTADDRLARYALTTFDLARRSDGIGPLHAPSKSRFASATYTLAWILMCRDFALWHANRDALAARLPGMRHALAGIGRYANADGLVEGLPGWSFTDWVQDARHGFVCGIAPDGKGLSSVNNLLYLLALRAAAFVERTCGDADYAALWTHKADCLSAAIRAAFWCPDRALFADTMRKDLFSEHAQCYALLADALPPDEARRCFEALVARKVDLAPASTYFSFYLFETFAKFGRADLIRARLEPWKTFLRLGAATPFENQDPEFRSDCHAWSAAPVYFMQTVFAGITPSSPGFGSVRIAPQPAGLKRVAARVPTPHGNVSVDLDFAEDGSVKGMASLPPGLSGTFEWKGLVKPLVSGANPISMPSR